MNHSKLMRFIQIDYYIMKTFRFFRVGWVTYGTTNQKTIWTYLSKPSAKQTINNLFRGINSIPVFLAMIATVASTSNLLDFTNIEVIYSIFLEYLKSLFKINFTDMLSKLPSVVALTTLIPVIFSFYFYNSKKLIQKAKNKNKEIILDEGILQCEKIQKWIDKELYKIAYNYSYVIDNQKEIVDLMLKGDFEEFKNKGTLFNINNTKFFSSSVKDLLNYKLSYFISSCFSKKYGFIKFYFVMNKIDSDSKIQQLSFTEEGLKQIINKKINNSTESRQKINDELIYNIYDNLKIIYCLKKYRDTYEEYTSQSKIDSVMTKALMKKN